MTDVFRHQAAASQLYLAQEEGGKLVVGLQGIGWAYIPVEDFLAAADALRAVKQQAPGVPRFEARGEHVFQLPLTKDDKTTMGFRVLSINEYITDGVAVAAIIAKLMNQVAKEFADD